MTRVRIVDLLTLCYCYTSSCFSLALSQYSGNNGTAENANDEQDKFLPDFSIPSSIPFYIYIPVLVVVVAVLLCTCVGWLGCCVLCCRHGRHRMVQIKETQKELGILEEQADGRVVRLAVDDQERRGTEEVVPMREVVTLERDEGEDERATTEENGETERNKSRRSKEQPEEQPDRPAPTINQLQESPTLIPTFKVASQTINSMPNDSGNHHALNEPTPNGNTSEEPHREPSNSQLRTETSTSENSPKNRAPVPAYQSDSLPNEMGASCRLAVSPPASATLPSNVGHSVNLSKNSRPVNVELFESPVKRRSKRRQPAQTSSYQEDSTSHPYDYLESSEATRRRHSSTGQETAPLQRSSIGHAEVFESLERVRNTFQVKNKTQTQKEAKETSV